jgi:calcium-dependent protein kinase
MMQTGIDSQLKLIDFGTAKICQSSDARMYTKIGSAYYVAPEVIEGNYDMKCDVWSLGVMLFVAFVGFPPFNGDSNA